MNEELARRRQQMTDELAPYVQQLTEGLEQLDAFVRTGQPTPFNVAVATTLTGLGAMAFGHAKLIEWLYDAGA